MQWTYASFLGEVTMAWQLSGSETIEKHWSISQDSLNELECQTNLNQLSERLRIAWKAIPPSTLENLVAGMT